MLLRYRAAIGAAALIVAIVGASAALRSQQAVAAPAYATIPVSRGDVATRISATGPLVARTSLPMSFKTGGRVAAVPVEAGDKVHAGDVLARLDDADLRQQFTQAQA